MVTLVIMRLRKPPSSFHRGMPADFPRMSKSAISIAAIADGCTAICGRSRSSKYAVRRGSRLRNSGSARSLRKLSVPSGVSPVTSRSGAAQP